MVQESILRSSRFGDDGEEFFLFFEIEPLEGEELAERLRLLEAEELIEEESV